MNGNVETVEASGKERQIVKDIEAVFERFYKGKKAYSKGQFYKGEFYLRTDYALVVLSKKRDILVSFADHTRPSYAALFTLLLDDIENTNLFVCEDYRTDQQGSMVLDETDGGSTSAIIWNEKDARDRPRKQLRRTGLWTYPQSKNKMGRKQPLHQSWKSNKSSATFCSQTFRGFT